MNIQRIAKQFMGGRGGGSRRPAGGAGGGMSGTGGGMGGSRGGTSKDAAIGRGVRKLLGRR